MQEPVIDIYTCVCHQMFRHCLSLHLIHHDQTGQWEVIHFYGINFAPRVQFSNKNDLCLYKLVLCLIVYNV